MRPPRPGSEPVQPSPAHPGPAVGAVGRARGQMWGPDRAAYRRDLTKLSTKQLREELEVTQYVAEQLMKLADGPAVFRNLDVLEPLP